MAERDEGRRVMWRRAKGDKELDAHFVATLSNVAASFCPDCRPKAERVLGVFGQALTLAKDPPPPLRVVEGGRSTKEGA